MMPDHKRPVTLEDILRLKRAERPPAEFWSQFDRELRAKQLSALVEKKPWWRRLSLPQGLSGFARFHLLIGATAVLAITFVATRDYRSAPTAAPASVSTAPVATAQVSVSDPSPAVAMVAAAPSADFTAAVPSAISASAEEAPVVAPAQTSINAGMPSFASAEASQFLVGDAAETEAATPSARFIAANFATARAAESTLRRSPFVQAHGFDMEVRTVASTRRSPVEPLARMPGPAEARANRFSAASAMAAQFRSDNPRRANDRVANDLSNEKLYESEGRRVGTRDGSLNINVKL